MNILITIILNYRNQIEIKPILYKPNWYFRTKIYNVNYKMSKFENLNYIEIIDAKLIIELIINSELNVVILFQ